MNKQIYGIQQLGVGVEDVKVGFEWYRKNFGMDIPVFDEKAVAKLMLPHTGGLPRERHAILAINLQGGGGFEIWQHTGKKPIKSEFKVEMGDLGIIAGKMKTTNINTTYNTFLNKGLNLLTEVTTDPSGNKNFFMMDDFGNYWQFVQHTESFHKTSAVNGGVFGAVIGVINIEDSLRVYSDILNYDTIIYDKTDSFLDFKGTPGGENKFRRVLLKHSEKRRGPFTPIFGDSQIELLQVLDREPVDIFKDRMWGDPGFIHLCFDIHGMDSVRKEVYEKGFPFTVDSTHQGETFDMGEAAGSFAYIQAPEGTLIEFVESHKVPIMKKWGLSIDLRKRQPDKPLPLWLLKMFGIKRVKN